MVALIMHIGPLVFLHGIADEEWRTYISQLRMAKSSTTSRYRVIISPPDYNNLAELQTVPIGVYHSFIWFHHYVAKDTPGMYQL